MSKEKINKLEAVHSFTVMPKDCNYNLDESSKTMRILFGGKLLYDLDFAAAKIARRATYDVDCDMVVTASVDKTNFEKPAFIGDIITYTSTIKAFGKSSIQIRIKVVREGLKGDIELISTSNMTFVTIKDSKPYKHNLTFEKLSKDAKI
jgi:acyl-CoA hydrolase